MYLNDHYIDYVVSWTKKATTTVAEATVAKFIQPKYDRELDKEDKVKFEVHHEQTARELNELFSTSEFNVILISDFYIDEYNGIWNLVKGNISQDGGTEYWTGTLWLESKNDYVKQSIYQEVFDNEFSELQEETSTFASLVNGNDEVGTWGTVGSGIGVTVDSGTNIYTIGYEWWNSFVFESDIQFSSLGTTRYGGFFFNYIDSSNYYRLKFYYDTTPINKIELQKQVNSVWTTLNTTNINQIVAGIDYNLKIIYSNGRIDVFFDSNHKFTVYDYDILTGKLGLVALDIAEIYTNVSVQQFIPKVTTIPTGFSNNQDFNLQSYIKTREGLLQYQVNTQEDVFNKHYDSRVLIGSVKVWDTMDNDFSNTSIDPRPLDWRRVYDPTHDFIGNMYIENGLFGILYTATGMYHYIYDKGYKKGDIIDLDFRQNPNYDVWNDNYSHRQLLSRNQGQRNWNEEGLEFEEVITGLSSTNTTDIVGSNGRIPQIEDGVFGDIMDYVIDIEYKADNTSYLNGGTNTGVLATNVINSTQNPFLVYHDYNNERLVFVTEINNPSNITYVGTTDNGSFPNNEWYTVKILKLQNQDGVMIYKDGILITQDNNFDYVYQDDIASHFEFGGIYSGTWSSYHFHGIIKKATFRLGNQGKVALKQTTEPLVWHSFDEKDWDNSTRTFVDKGSAGVDLSLNGTPLLQKDGRYNQCLKTNDGYVENTSLTTQLDNLSAFTIECWIKYSDTVANYHYIMKCETVSVYDRTFALYFDASNLVLGFHDGGSYPKVEVLHGNHTIDTDQKWHHITGTWDGTYLKIYIDGVLKATSTDYSAFTVGELPEKISICENSVGGGFDALIDEVIISDYVKSPSEFGVIIPDIYETGQEYNLSDYEQINGIYRKREISNSDTGTFVDLNNEIPNLLGEYQNYTSLYSSPSANEFDKGWTLQKITPEFTEVKLNAPKDEISYITSRIESGEYFHKLDFSKMPYSDYHADGIYFVFESDYYHRFTLAKSESTFHLFDMGIERVGKYQSNFNTRFLLDNPTNNMILAQSKTKDGVKDFYSYHSNGLINAVIMDIDDGQAIMGMIPQRVVNEVFVDMTQSDYIHSSSVIGNYTDNWFISAFITGLTGFALWEARDMINYQKYPKGLYLVIGRGKGGTATSDWMMRMFDGVKYINSEDKKTGTSWQYSYALCNVTSDQEENDMRIFIRTEDSESHYADYYVIIPLSNGIDFPLDLVRNSLQLQTKKKII